MAVFVVVTLYQCEPMAVFVVVTLYQRFCFWLTHLIFYEYSKATFGHILCLVCLFFYSSSYVVHFLFQLIFNGKCRQK